MNIWDLNIIAIGKLDLGLWHDMSMRFAIG
jgi:hypothetical protein